MVRTLPYLRLAILDVANGDINTLLDNSFKRPLFSLYYPVELFFLPEVVGDCFLAVNNMLSRYLPIRILSLFISAQFFRDCRRLRRPPSSIPLLLYLSPTHSYLIYFIFSFRESRI